MQAQASYRGAPSMAKPTRRKAVKAKKSTRKPIPRSSRKPPKPPKPLMRFPSAFEDLLERPKAPGGRAYQWAPLGMTPELQAEGWLQVPSSRHRDLPPEMIEGDHVTFRGMMLVERDKAQEKAAISGATAAAVKQFNDAGAAFGYQMNDDGLVLPSPPDRFFEGRRTRTIDAVHWDYAKVSSSAPDMFVQVTVPLRITSRFQDAASSLGISVEDYAQRRMALYAQGRIAGILIYCQDGTPALDLVEISLNSSKEPM